MASEQDRRFWENTLGNDFEPLHLVQREPASPEERAAHAAEFTAFYTRKISEQLESIHRLLLERREGT